MLKWLKESIEFLLKNNFFVIIKAHPSEKSWKPTKSVIDYFEERENLLLISADSNIFSYDIIKKADYISVYNGTIFYESLIMNKKVILGGKIGELYHKSKKEYFNQFFNYTPYNLKKAMEYAYKILFLKTVPLNMIDNNLEYPHIKVKEEKEIVFRIIQDIIEGKYDANKYIDSFIPQY